jgi:predicted helicase
LLTNYIDWIWLKEGNIQKRETLCYLTDIEDKKGKLDPVKVKAVEKLIISFFSQAPKEIADSGKLAEALAVRAKLLKDFLFNELKRQEKEHQDGRLYQLFETFKNFVFQELNIEEFADAFAQNLAYGLFLAKLNADTQCVNLYNAKKYIPASFELIRELVSFLDELDNEEYRETKWIVEEVLTIMNNLDLRAIHTSLSFTKKEKDIDGIAIKDPYVYFYEDFLAYYDKKLRKSKGVYYTPPPVVNFIVRAMDDILKKSFQIAEGLADRNNVTILDFATGTGTFLAEIFQQIFEKLPKDSGKKNLIIQEHLLKNIFGFEYLIAPYTIAHLKLSQFLKENNYELKAKERLQIYLTNTLEQAEIQHKINLLPALTEESRQAQKIKDNPILVITGNPPYSKKSKNNSSWIVNLVDDYKFVDGKRSQEKQNWYRDDYIKFIRFAQNKMDKIEEGIVGVITNHTFINNVTMAGMRQSLMNSFDQIYIVNLNGNAKQEMKLPDGITKDENVFDIEQGVAISLFIKHKGLKKKVCYADFWGARKNKYKTCLENSIHTVDWIELTPQTPDYYFIPKDERHKNEYQKFYSVTDIFKIFSLPLMTGNDRVTVHFEKPDLVKTLESFSEKSIEKIKMDFNIEKDTSNWTAEKAKNDIVKTKIEEKYFINIFYRLFDIRTTYYTGNTNGFLSRPQYKVCKNMLHENIGLLLPRQISKSEFRHVFCTKYIPDMCAFSTATKEANQLFPLYLYPDATFEDERVEEAKKTKKENFTAEFRNYIDNLYGKGIKPEQVLGYIYAILYSPAYRAKYNEFLKDKFARIPFTNDKALFKKLSKLGKELIDAQLSEERVGYQEDYFRGEDSDIVREVSFIQGKKTGRIYINATQYYDNVPLKVWKYKIGGFAPVKKYLTERKNRKLESTEIEKVEIIIKAITFTIEQMKKINTLTKNWI